jgi:hypothetical protein
MFRVGRRPTLWRGRIKEIAFQTRKKKDGKRGTEMKTAILNASARVLCKDAATYGDAFEKIQRHIIDIRSKKDKLETK